METTKIVEFLGVAVIASVATGFVAYLAGQPPLFGFIITGTLFGSLLKGNEIILASFSELGIALLLFLVGLELNPSRVRNIGKEVLLLGAGQVGITTLAGIPLLLAFGFSLVPAALFSLGLAFSSTAVVLKILGDRNALDSLPARLTVGVLLMQDIMALLVLLFFGAATPAGFALSAAVFLALTVFGFLAFPAALERIHRNAELTFFAALGWLFLFMLLGYQLKLGAEIPALLAGVSLSGSIYGVELGKKLRPLRDLFLLFFFIGLGMQITVVSLASAQTLALAAFVLAADPLIVLLLVGLGGYENRVGFSAGVSLAQVSEFSLLMVSMGAARGVFPQSAVALIGGVALVTFFVSSWLMYNQERAYRFLKPLVEFVASRRPAHRAVGHAQHAPAVVVFGYHRMGSIIVKRLLDAGVRPLVVEFNPEAIALLQRNGVPYLFGDAADAEVLDRVDFGRVKLMVSTIPNENDTVMLIAAARQHNVPIVVTALTAKEALELYREGASYVIIPHFLGGEFSGDLVRRVLRGEENIAETREKHISEVERRLRAERAAGV